MSDIADKAMQLGGAIDAAIQEQTAALDKIVGGIHEDVRDAAAQAGEALTTARQAVDTTQQYAEQITSLQSRIEQVAKAQRDYIVANANHLAELETRVSNLESGAPTDGGGDTDVPTPDPEPSDPTPVIEITSMTSAELNAALLNGHRDIRNVEIRGGIHSVRTSPGDAKINGVKLTACKVVAAGHVGDLISIQDRTDAMDGRENWSLIRCNATGEQAPDQSTHQLAYFQGMLNLLIDGGVYVRGGWGTRIIDGASTAVRSDWSHNFYMHKMLGKTRVQNATIAQASHSGAKLNGFDEFHSESNVYDGNMVDITVDGREPANLLTSTHDTFQNTGGIKTNKSGVQTTLAWSFDVRQNGDDPYNVKRIVLDRSRWFGPGVTTGPRWSGAKAIRITGRPLNQGGAIESVLLSGCDLSRWDGERLYNGVGDRMTVEPGNIGI